MNDLHHDGGTALTPAALRVAGVSKSFGAVRALRNVSLEFRAGQVTALLGENGAGKSTLIRVCSGVMQPDTGQVLVDGSPVDWRGPIDGIRSGVVVVNQEPQLVSELTVADNIFLSDLSGVPGAALVHRRRAVQRARELLARLEMTEYLPSPDTVCRHLSAAERQMVDIVRALSHDPKVLFLDEPNSSLTHQETERLWAVVDRMRSNGVAVVLVSHRLAEVYEIADHVVVLRDGAFVKDGPASAIDQEHAVSLMAGAKKTEITNELHAHVVSEDVEPALSLRALSGDGFEQVNVDFRPGEVVGMAGLIGAGRTEIAAGVIGLTHVRAGEMRLFGRAVLPRNPRHAQRLGIAYVAEERPTEVYKVQSVGFNLTARIFDRLSRFGIVPRRAVMKSARDLADRFGVKTSSVHAPITSLSGGNQQKVLLARALAAKPRVLILDEPTRGVDVGTKAEIYALLKQLARTEQLAVWFISSEMEEVLELADRIVVVRHGRIVRDAPNTADPTPVIAAAMGVTESDR